MWTLDSVVKGSMCGPFDIFQRPHEQLFVRFLCHSTPSNVQRWRGIIRTTNIRTEHISLGTQDLHDLGCEMERVDFPFVSYRARRRWITFAGVLTCIHFTFRSGSMDVMAAA